MKKTIIIVLIICTFLVSVCLTVFFIHDQNAPLSYDDAVRKGYVVFDISNGEVINEDKLASYGDRWFRKLHICIFDNRDFSEYIEISRAISGYRVYHFNKNQEVRKNKYAEFVWKDDDVSKALYLQNDSDIEAGNIMQYVTSSTAVSDDDLFMIYLRNNENYYIR